MPIRAFSLRSRLAPGILLAVSLAATAPRADAAPLFGAPFLSFDVGGSPSSVAIGDLNGDGRPDLAVANSTSGTVSVLLGNGDDSFGAKTDYGTGGGPNSVATGDRNGGGRTAAA